MNKFPYCGDYTPEVLSPLSEHEDALACSEYGGLESADDVYWQALLDWVEKEVG